MTKQNKGRKFFATTATAALVASAIVPVASAAEFQDAASISSWAKEAVQFLTDKGYIQGDEKETSTQLVHLHVQKLLKFYLKH